MIFGGLIGSMIFRQVLTVGMGAATDAIAKRVAQPAKRIAATPMARGAAPVAKPISSSATMWFADFLLSAGIWIEVLPMISDAIDKANLLGRYEGLFLAGIAFAIKALRFKTTRPIS